MNLEELITVNITEYCIACLTKSPNMHSLSENAKKLELFTNLFGIKLSDFQVYPNYLCSDCDIKLNLTSNFHQCVKKSLVALEQYNKKNYSNGSDEDQFKEELCDNVDNLQNVKTEDDIGEKLGVKSYRSDNSKVKLVNPDLVEQAIETFKNRFSENKTCIICGFMAANRRSISSHMAIFHKDLKNSWCLECNEVFQNYEEHKESHSSRRDCPFCNKSVSLPHYVEHLQSHSGIFECKECHKTFKSAAWLTKHSRIHTNEKPYICPNCSKGFIQLSSLRYHLTTHGKYSCDKCNKHYKTKRDSEDHECLSHKKDVLTKEIWIKSEGTNTNEVEPAETIIIKGTDKISTGDLQNFCKDCNKRVKSLKQHIEKYHTLTNIEDKTKEVECELCQKTFSTTYKLKIHIRTHTGQLPYKCKFCDRRTLTRSRLKDHERTHTKEKPYICNVCGKALSQSSALRTHMRQHTGRPELCTLCNKTFCRKSELKLHLSKHMGEKPFLCTQCGRSFAQRSHLTEHMASHSEERPFGCSYCAKCFKTNNLLKEHLKLHQGYKRFQCPTCTYACYKAYRLQQHMKQHTNDSYENIEISESVMESPSHIEGFSNETQLNVGTSCVQNPIIKKT